MSGSDGEYGADLVYDDALEAALQRAERGSPRAGPPPAAGAADASVQAAAPAWGPEARDAAVAIPDIEDLGPGIPAPGLAPFDEFRRKGFLSVSDLVGTVWCEVQYD